MRLIDADALERRIMMMPDDELCEDCCYNVVNAIYQVPTISVKPKRESMAMLPCKCGCKRREHWYGNKKGYERTLVCKRCGFEVHGENDTDVIRKWNEAVKRDEAD